MNRRAFTVRFLLVLGTLSLFGVIAMQLFWVRNAVGLQEKQCDHRVMVALQMINGSLVSRDGSMFFLNQNYRSDPADSLDLSALDPESLDSLILDKFCELNIVRPFFYGFLCRNDSNFIAGNFEGHEDQLIASDLYTNFAVSPGDPGYSISVAFDESGSTMLSQMLVWVVLSAVFTLILILSFGSTILALLRQKRIAEVKNDFVNNMTHEFKTPISTIGIASEMLMRDGIIPDSEKARRYARIIHSENKRLEGLVESILQIALLERGDYQISLQEFDINEVIEKRCDVICPAIYQKGGEISMSLSAERSRIMADKMHVINVISNLLDNAMKYSVAKPVISIRTSNSDDGVLIEVVDNGIGIRPEHQKQVFNKFFRVKKGDVHDVKGFGLGLYYSKTILEAHGGYIKLSSEPGKGSKFTVFFPHNPKIKGT